MAPIPLPKNPAWQFYPESGEVRHSRSGVVALTFTMNKRRLAKISMPTGTEVLVEVPATLPPGLLPVPRFPEYGFSQAEGKVYRVQGGWATFIPRALVPYQKKGTTDYYVWLLPSKGMGNKRQVNLVRLAHSIAEQQGLPFAWLCENLPGVYQPTATDSTEMHPDLWQGDHSGHPVASGPEPTGAQHEAPPQEDGWYWWYRGPMGHKSCHYVRERGTWAVSLAGVSTTTERMGGLWGTRAPEPENGPRLSFGPKTPVEGRPCPADRNASSEPKFIEQPSVSQRRLPWFEGWYWWRETKAAQPIALYVEHGGRTGKTGQGTPIIPDEMGGEWGYLAPAPESSYDHEAEAREADTTEAPEPRYLRSRERAAKRLPLLDGWYWWRSSEMSPSDRFRISHGGNQATSTKGRVSVPIDLGGEWGYRAPAPCNLEQETGNLEDNPIPEPAYLPGAELDKIHAEMLKAQTLEPLPSPFDLYPEGDPRWTEGEPETVEAPTPVPVFQPRIF